MHQRNRFSSKTQGKSRFHFQNGRFAMVWSASFDFWKASQVTSPVSLVTQRLSPWALRDELKNSCEGDSLAVNRILFNVVVTLQVRMYCSSRPKQPGFSFEALFPDELFPPGNKQKGKKYIVLLCFIEQCASGSKCQLIVRTTYYILTCTCMSVC